jgi:hypothetical protein
VASAARVVPLVLIVATDGAMTTHSFVPRVNRRANHERERQARQAYYESVLRSYTGTFKPGATRTQVENYLRNNGKEIMHMCCMNATHDASDTLTKIGEERPPWYCTLN